MTFYERIGMSQLCDSWIVIFHFRLILKEVHFHCLTFFDEFLGADSVPDLRQLPLLLQLPNLKLNLQLWQQQLPRLRQEKHLLPHSSTRGPVS